MMETNFGTMEIELLFDHAPLTAKNFYDLVNKKFYDSLTFHRLVPSFVIQGGDPEGTGMGGPGYTIKDEKSTQPQVRGTLGMAKSGPNTTGSQFYINLIDNTRLDGAGFTGFAKVVKGMEVADKISAFPRDASDKPKQPVVILKAYLKPEAEVKPKGESQSGK
ncbi:MAG: peptidylprolyl isomerase [candidate division Zixibacteria bacterium]|nr:peptidylprolyl isomerase [candidate division Zixibacteria bacterium]